MRVYGRAKQSEDAVGAAAPDAKKFDVWIPFFNPDLPFAMRFADALIDLGYTVAPRIVVRRADKKLDQRLMPHEARCVIALWTPDALEDLQVQGDARTAGLKGELIEVGLRGARPQQRFSDAALIAFARTDNAPHGDAWRALFARVQELCGPPPRKSPDFMRKAPALAATAATIAGAVVVGAMFGQHEEARKEIADRTFAPPATQEVETALLKNAKRPSLTPIVDLPADVGGPKDADFIAPDLGTAPKQPVPSAPPPATSVAPVERGPLGPEQ